MHTSYYVLGTVYVLVTTHQVQHILVTTLVYIRHSVYKLLHVTLLGTVHTSYSISATVYTSYYILGMYSGY